MKATLLKSSMLRCVLLAAALAPLLTYAQTSSANTCDSSVVFPASVSQGALVFGKTPAGSEVRYGGRSLRTTAYGTVVFGVGRDEKGPLQLTVTMPSGSCKPTPIVAMNRSVALARVQGPKAGLKAVEGIPNRHSLEAQHLYHAIRASFLEELGHSAEARAAYQRAAALAPCDAERDFLQSRVQ